ncbi:hypothetical protein LVY72_20995 [Arthrobacter sp. I2-34]|uniref:Asp23/Gls24 family envelope stress response protein n=1 Tax=Arthrobacter hankyongi TaxID=2904801 RepID=A0ABS9LCN1_9MICC|nr:hypothetical protein [Arthrobacter hankyongi]MCG2624373.1 hypothetical protein [Arthrobacter hankyongi]
MSERPLEARLINSDLVADLAARAALDTPGVLRLEPTLKNLLAHLGAGTAHILDRTRTDSTPTRRDGVFATVHDGVADIHLDIATDIAYTALTVAQAVRVQIARAVSHTGLTPGRIDIAILAIEHPPAATEASRPKPV